MNPVQTISLSQIIEHLKTDKSFDIEYVTCDRKRGTGGALKAYSQVLKSNAPSKRRGKMTKARAERRTVNPNHSIHDTFNIYVPFEPDPDNRIKKVHLRLITLFNGKEPI